MVKYGGIIIHIYLVNEMTIEAKMTSLVSILKNDMDNWFFVGFYVV